MKRSLTLLVVCVLASTGVLAYHEGTYNHGFDTRSTGYYGDYYDDHYGEYYADHYGGYNQGYTDPYYYETVYDDPIYVDYDGLGYRGGYGEPYRCIGSGCYATDYLHAWYGSGYGRHGSYGCHAYYCRDDWNDNYEYIVPAYDRSPYNPYW